LRVRLIGPPENPTGIGAGLRLVYPQDRFGPLQEVASGSGYWSQDSPVLVLGGAESAVGVWVRWLGQPPRTLTLPQGAREVQISSEGVLRVAPR
jgi:hypothetical protein